MDTEEAVEAGRIAGIEALILISEDFASEDIKEVEEYVIPTQNKENNVT